VRRRRGRVDGLGLASAAAVTVGAAAGVAAVWLAWSRGPLMGNPPVPLMLALGSTLALALALVCWREREARRTRRAFVDSVSHEFRTALAHIRLFTETLRADRVRTPEDRERSVAIIGQQARRLEHLVETVRSYDALARHGVVLKPRAVSAADVLEDAHRRFAALAISRDIQLEIEVPHGLTIFADADALTQILASLLDNAVKYGTGGGAVRMGAEPGAACARLWIEDAGPGVPAADRESVWEPFRRLSRDPESATGGGGLGLTVVRALVRLHGGRCWVEDAPAGGARFVVELPEPT